MVYKAAQEVFREFRVKIWKARYHYFKHCPHIGLCNLQHCLGLFARSFNLRELFNQRCFTTLKSFQFFSVAYLLPLSRIINPTIGLFWHPVFLFRS